MDIQFITDTIHERRAGIDMIALPYAEETYFAEPDVLEYAEGNTLPVGFEIPRT